MTDALNALLKAAAEKVKAMSPEAREEMMRKQREGYVKAEMSWPKPKFHYENGVKVYHSYEDYLND
ncbi:MAG: hypothetical protein WC763_07405 [Candidatus Paceibacterota bacterium]|jgi:hypothetical protein